MLWFVFTWYLGSPRTRTVRIIYFRLLLFAGVQIPALLATINITAVYCRFGLLLTWPDGFTNILKNNVEHKTSRQAKHYDHRRNRWRAFWVNIIWTWSKMWLSFSLFVFDWIICGVDFPEDATSLGVWWGLEGVRAHAYPSGLYCTLALFLLL